jgi:tetratricopeptide (TPR) repeat protein
MKQNGKPPSEQSPTESPQTMTIEQAVATAYQHWNAGQGAQAEHLCQQVLQAWPEHAAALHLMGLLAFTAGNRPLAIEYIQRACKAPSAPALFHSNLAEMLRQEGKLTEAEAAARQALVLDGQLAAGWTNLGIVLQEAGKLEESLEALRRALAMNPNGAENHNNLGNTLKRLDRLEEARAAYEAALQLKPGYAEARNNLAYLLNSLGQADAAMAEIRKAIEINPHYIDAYINAAAIALGQNAPEEGLRWLDNLASFAPQHAGGLAARARVLMACDRDAEAVAVARQSVVAAPESGEAAEDLAQALSTTGKTDEALASFDRAAALPCPQRESALIGKAALLDELGRTAEAQETLNAALQVNPYSARVLFNRTAGKKYAAGDGEIAQMEEVLASGKLLTRDDQLMLRFALGKAWLDVGDADKAFAHLAEGNRLKRSTFAYDAAATEHWMASVAEAFSAVTLERLAEGGDASEVPVFVVGLPRSGTTLIEQILAAHPKVHGAGELKVMQQITDRTAGPDGRIAGFPQMILGMQLQDVPKLGRYYLDRVRPKAPGAARIVDKMPANFLYAGLIHAILPKARIIHSMRGEADTCLSCYTKLFAGEQRFTYELSELGRFANAYKTLMAHWRSVLPAETFLEVRYEDVVDDLEGQAKRMIGFLGLDWDPACLAYYKNKRQIRTASLEQVRQPIYRSSVGRWKKYASHLGPLLQTLGMTP